MYFCSHEMVTSSGCGDTSIVVEAVEKSSSMCFKQRVKDSCGVVAGSNWVENDQCLCKNNQCVCKNNKDIL